jgi:hypothetical protein
MWLSVANESQGQGEGKVLPSSVHPLTVNIVVGGDEELRGRVKSYFSSELRDLKDVKISDLQPTFVIDCVVDKLSRGGSTTGFAMSFVVTSNLKALKYLADDFTQKQFDGNPIALASFITGCRLIQEIEMHQLISGPLSNLREDCGEEIADFDGKCLVPLRAASMVGRVLTNRNVVKRDGGEYTLLGYENLAPDQVQRLKAACELKLFRIPGTPG